LDAIIRTCIDPFVAQRLLSRAERHLVRNQPAQAVRDAREAVRLCPTLPRSLCILGIAYLHERSYQEALQTLTEAARRDGETPDVLYALGCCYHEMKQPEAARRALEKMLAGFAKDAAAHYTLGQLDLEAGCELAARRNFQKAAFLDFLLVRDRLRALEMALQERKQEPFAPPDEEAD